MTTNTKARAALDRLGLLARAVGRLLGRVGREVGWWVGRSGRLWWRHKITATVHPLLVVVAWRVQLELWAVMLTLPVVGIGLWARIGPVSYWMRLGGPVEDWRLKRRVRKAWPVIMESVGLARSTPTTTRTTSGGLVPADRVMVPALHRLRWVGGELVAWPGLLTGQTVEDVQAVTDRLRVALDAYRCRIQPNPALTACTIVWSFHDPLERPFLAAIPAGDAPPGDLRSVVLGRTEDGPVWRLPLGLSTLTAGCSGAGKASLIWALVIGLGPANKAGLVQLHGIDLKGGMELTMGRALFTRYAQTADTAVILLEDAARELQARAARLAGITRQHTPTVADPLVVVVIDELAALVAYSPDRDLVRRAEAALSVILSQGRAVGYVVFAFVQDPRKETVKMRHLFTQAIGLRLRDREEVAMVLGDGAIAAGALCHKIPATMPGVGYALGEENRPVRVRAGYVTDDMITTAARLFPAEADVPIIVPDPPEPTRSRTSTAGARSSGVRSSRARAAMSEDAG